MKVLIAGESWVTHAVHIKGFDTFTTSSYEEGAHWLIEALEKAGNEVDYMPNHEALIRFPSTVAELEKYDVLLLSDIGTNTLLLSPTTFNKSERRSNPLDAIAEYVESGGALVMVGGYMSFQGIDGKARYHGTPVEEVLPVIISATDDRVEAPEGIRPRVLEADHPIIAGIAPEWPHVLGYNRVNPRESSKVIVQVNTDPLVVVSEVGQGRSMAFTSDVGPHWAPSGFVEWEGFARFWSQAIAWLGKK